MTEQYAIYLRKSRADQEAERRGEGETLQRHRTQLLALAAQRQLRVDGIYEELVSGETISQRPRMQQLLEEVSCGRWTGVLCMEIERLARGDSIDQGIVARAFQYSGTQIITPLKCYNPADEFDTEYFEFSLFMSRREYKTINRRMQSGRASAVREGNYIGSQPPYGYRKITTADGLHTLAPIPAEADTVRLLYEWFTKSGTGYAALAARLNAMQIPPKRVASWSGASVRAILENPIYCGKLRWNYRKGIRQMENGRLRVHHPLNPDALLYDGMHPPLISTTLWEQAQQCRRARSKAGCTRTRTLKNPFAGILFCALCGEAMLRRPYAEGTAQLLCPNPECSCVGSAMPVVMAAVQQQLMADGFSVPEQEAASTDDTVHVQRYLLQTQQRIAQQEAAAHTLLEQGVYSVCVFQQRMQALAAQRDALLTPSVVPPPAERLARPETLGDWFAVCEPAHCNTVLRERIIKIEYYKTHKCNATGESDLAVHILYR